MKQGDTRKKGESGQSTIEFALSLTLMMGFVLFFIQLSFLFAYGNLVHYATFMAARAYLAAGMESENQVDRARQTVISLLKKSEGEPGVEKYAFIARGEGGNSGIPGLTVGPGDQWSAKNQDLSWMQGVRYSFRGKVSMMPLGAGNSQSVNTVTLTSESWLGKDTSVVQCQTYMQKMGGMIDNGC